MAIAAIWDDFFKAHTVDAPTDGHFNPRIIQLSNGNFLIAWWTSATTGAASPAGFDIVGRIFDPVGNEVKAEFILNDFSTGDSEFDFELSAHPNGGFSVAYEDAGTLDYNIRIDSYDSTGTHVNSDSIIEDPDGNNGGNPHYRNPNVTSGSSTNILTTYEVFDSSGPDVTIVGKIYNSVTDTVGSEFSVTSTYADGAGEGIGGHSTTTLTTGEHVVAFANINGAPNDEIIVRILNADGTQTSQPGAIIVDASFDDAYDPHVVALSNGNFVVTWTVDSSGGTNTGIRARVYNHDGVAQTAVLEPVFFTAGNEFFPAVAALDNGKFVIVWADETRMDIDGQVYNADGTKDDGTFGVIDYVSSTLVDLDVTGFADGRFAVTWSVNFNNSDIEVYSRIEDPRSNANSNEADGYQIGTPFDDTFSVDTDTFLIYGWDGNDRISIDAARVAPASVFDGGEGSQDVLVLTNSGTYWDFENKSLSGFEEIEFDTGIVSGSSRRADFEAAQIPDVKIFDFYGGFGDSEELRIYMGVASSLNLYDIDIQDFSFDDDVIMILGDNTNESITGTVVRDIILGNAGSDDLNGYDGDDILAGGSGNDTLYGGKGADVLDGGDGAEDKISYFSSDAGVAVNLTTSSASGGDATGDTFAQIESIAGSDFNDSLTGDNFNNRLEGSGGSDDLNGLGGADSILGGDGLDTIYYLSSPSAVTINLTTGVGSGGDAQGDILSSIEWVHGSAHGDSLTGNGDLVNAFYGNGGNDHIAGFGGNDTYIGGAGNDTFYSHNTGGEDLISDFEGVGAAVGDQINLQDFGFANFAQVQLEMTDAAVDIVKIQLDANDVLFVRGTGVSIATLTENDFIL